MRRDSRLRFPLLLLACTTIAASMGAQAPQQNTAPQNPTRPPTFRGGANYIRVDLYASTSDGLVTDLRQNEVEIFEDGVRQQIESFELVRIPPGGPEPLRVEPNSIAASQQMAADPRARVFVVFLDTYHMDVQVAQQLAGPVRRFLEEALGPDDLAAVTTPEASASDLSFTRRTTVLSGILADTTFWLHRDATMVGADPVERMYEQCYGPADMSPITAAMIARRREKLSLDALEELARHLGTLRDERKTVLVISKGWRLFEESDSLAANSPFAGTIPGPDDRLRGGRASDGSNGLDSSTRSRCEADRMALAHLDHRNRIREITGAANRGNVSFYPLSPLRIESTIDTRSNLRALAEETDGLAIVNTNNFLEPIQRVIADTSAYYLLGYQSTNGALDGRYRKITVQVTRPGIRVRARRGYRAASMSEVREAAATAAAKTPPRADSGIIRALGRIASGATPSPLRIRTSSWTRPGSVEGAGQVWVVGELDAQVRGDAAAAGAGRAEMAVIASDGSQVAARAAEIPKGQRTFVVAIPETGTLPPGEYTVRVRLRTEAGAGEPIADSVTATVPDRATTLGEPVLFRRGPSSGIRYVETADPRFRRTERLRMELPTSAADPAAARVLDRTGKPLQVPATVTTRDDPSGRFHWVVVDATLAPFAPGDYVIEVTQQGVSQLVGFRLVQ